MGNQIFQYCFARALSLKYKRNLRIDYSALVGNRGEKYRKIYPGTQFRLNEYSICADFVSKFLARYIYLIRRKRIYKFFNIIARVKFFNKLIPVYMREGEIEEEDIDKFKNVFIEGHWTDFDSLNSYNSIIKNELSLKNELSQQNGELLKEILTVNSVSIHFIRGIKVSDLKHRKIFHESSLQYFINAYNYIYNHVTSPKFYIFSNDIKWVKRNWPENKIADFIDNDGPDFEHHFLMSRCKHNIVDNSTFSYTAAFLNNNQSKIIISPKIWMKQSNFSKPKSWIVMDN